MQMIDENLYILLDSNHSSESTRYSIGLNNSYKIKHGINIAEPILYLSTTNIDQFKSIYGDDNVIVKELSDIDITKVKNIYDLCNTNKFLIPICIKNPMVYNVFKKDCIINFLFNRYLTNKIHKFIIEKTIEKIVTYELFSCTEFVKNMMWYDHYINLTHTPYTLETEYMKKVIKDIIHEYKIFNLLTLDVIKDMLNDIDMKFIANANMLSDVIKVNTGDYISCNKITADTVNAIQIKEFIETLDLENDFKTYVNQYIKVDYM
jgi:hypothetical protein